MHYLLKIEKSKTRIMTQLHKLNIYTNVGLFYNLYT